MKYKINYIKVSISSISTIVTYKADEYSIEILN